MGGSDFPLSSPLQRVQGGISPSVFTLTQSTGWNLSLCLHPYTEHRVESLPLSSPLHRAQGGISPSVFTLTQSTGWNLSAVCYRTLASRVRLMSSNSNISITESESTTAFVKKHKRKKVDLIWHL